MITIGILDPARNVASALALWRRAIGAEFPLDERLFRQQLALEDSPSLFLGASSAGETPRLEGMILAKRVSRPGSGNVVPPSGNISFLAVDPAMRRRGIGSALLARAEDWLAGEGARDLRFGADTWHLFPGIPERLPEEGGAGSDFAPARGFAEARGFVPGGLEHDVAADLGRVDPFSPGIAATELPGYRTTIFDSDTRSESATRSEMDAFFARCFPGRWRRDVARMIDAGMRPEDLLLLEETATGRVSGFALLFSKESTILGPGLYWRGLMGENPGGLGPIGVDEALRGRGLGLHLLATGLAELKSRGCRFTVIDWTDLVGFYAKFGFTIWKSYRMYSKRLEEGAFRKGGKT